MSTMVTLSLATVVAGVVALGAPGSVAGLVAAAAHEALVAGQSTDRMIRRAFEDVLDRDPTSSELRHYRRLVEDEDWDERDIRDDLRRRDDNRGRNSNSSHGGDPDRIVRRAYEDILDREPDDAGLRLYRSRIIDEGWTEEDVRDALRKSPEYRTKSAMTRSKAEDIVRRAYENVFDRAPDSGSRSYVDHVMRDKWTQADVERELRKSPEYRQKSTMTREKAEDVVRRAYETVLKREPDASSRAYVDRVLRDKWTQADVERELRKSDEYRNRPR
jgi:TorA maturation chaperone TorD